VEKKHPWDMYLNLIFWLSIAPTLVIVGYWAFNGVPWDIHKPNTFPFSSFMPTFAPAFISFIVSSVVHWNDDVIYDDEEEDFEENEA
jgi:hypothetical protein